MEVKNAADAFSVFNTKQPAVPKTDSAPFVKKTHEEFLQVNQEQEPPKEGFLKSILDKPSLRLAFFGALGLADCFLIKDIFKLAKLLKNKAGKEALKTFRSDFIDKAFKLQVKGVAAGLGLGGILYFINKKMEPKNEENIRNTIDAFNKEHKTNVRLEIGAVSNPLYMGGFSHAVGKITVSDKLTKDILLNALYTKGVLKHELAHVKQYTEMARLDNGIEQLNYQAIKIAAGAINGNDLMEGIAAYKEIKSGLADEYKDTYVQFEKGEYPVRLFDYIEACCKYFNGAKPNEIPIIINKEFYEQANKNKPPMTPEEKAKAQAYLEAHMNYIDPQSIEDVENKDSPYNQNLLEIEAREAVK